MINRRSTPSGDGRGRGRSGGHAGRGGRPAFRSDDRRGGDRDSLRADRGGSRARYGKPADRGGSDRPGSDRPGSDRAGSDRAGSDRGGERRGSERRGAERRDDRSGYGRDDRSGYARDDRGGYGRRDDRSGAERRDGRGGYGRRDDTSGYGRSGYGRDNDRSGFERRDDRGGSGRREERGGYGRRDDRSGSARGDQRGGFGRRDDRGGSGRDRGAYERRDDRRGGDRDSRPGYNRDSRPGYSRDDRPGYSRDDRPGYSRDDRSGYGRDNDRSGFERRDDRAGYGRRDERGGDEGQRDGFRAARGGRRDATPRPGGSRARYGKRDEVQTIGGSRTGGRAPSRSQGPRREEKPENRFKTARQPLRDADFYEPGYTDERDTTEVPGGVRLQKVLAQAGVASRRACEEMIGDGRVTVNGQVVRRFGAKVDPATQVIHVDGKRIPTAPDLVYYALNKPIGVVSTMEDPQGRPCLADYVQELAPRLFHVGRLDTETEGLLLLTNDGELANRLTHPSYGVQKKYWAKVPGPIPRDLGRRLREGVELEDGIARADSFSIVQEHGQQALVEVVLHEGRKHVVRRMLEEAGHRVIDLARIEFGPVKLGRTKPGTIRALSLKEVGELYAAVKL
ncbi:pseudouridine synthase [Nonomuraea typhae]|uniref:pseudouridine synthase n=1 Tax=Nonomuraea typhae TaxID=2603600 RepID=UPI001FE7EF05|nr:pseudouridine synthase [Nonomuraea typhae]